MRAYLNEKRFSMVDVMIIAGLAGFMDLVVRAF